MAIRNIIQEGDEVLRKNCRKITEFNPRLHQLLDDMRDTLINADGAGLAAPQVGVLRACAIVLLSDGSYLEIVNPVIEESSGSQEDAEGCLSIPGKFGIVNRPMYVTVRAQDRFGKEFTYNAEGFTARAFCHEIDHLSGGLFTDKVIRYIDPDEYYGGGEEK